MNGRLSRADWLNHGLETLADEGVVAIKVGPMAKAMGVSRGSFYWHFDDIEAFLTALLDGWEEATTSQVIEETDPGAGRAALMRLINRSLADDMKLDRAVRAWAVQSDAVAARIARVDTRRVEHIRALLESCGLDRRQAQHRAQFLYWSYLGRNGLRVDDQARPVLARSLTEMLLA